MIKEIQRLLDQYKYMAKQGAEYVSVGQVTNDLYQLLQQCRLRRIPKNER